MATIVETYRGVPIEIDEWLAPSVRVFRFDAGLICSRIGRGRVIGGDGTWSADTLEQARAEIDGFLAEAGVTELPPPQSWQPTAAEVRVSLTRAELVARVHTVADALDLARVVRDPVFQAALGLPLLAWQVATPASGVVQFTRYDEAGFSSDHILAINAPESRRGEFVRGPIDESVTVLMVG